jgi:hypothetical protein
MTNARVPLNIKQARHRIERAQGAPYTADCLRDDGKAFEKAAPGYIWVREVLSNDPTSGNVVYGQAYQVRATGTFIPYYGARVRVTYDDFDGEWGIERHDFKSFVEQGGNPAIFNPLNPALRNGTTETLPLLKSFAVSNPDFPTTEISIKNYVGIDYLSDMQAFSLANDSRPDLSDYAPATSGFKRLVHFWLDYDGTVATSQSTAISTVEQFDITLDLQETFDERPNQLAKPIGVWIATNGKTETTATDFYMDTRQFIDNPQMSGFPNPVANNWVFPPGTTAVYHSGTEILSGVEYLGDVEYCGETVFNQPKGEAYQDDTGYTLNNSRGMSFQNSQEFVIPTKGEYDIEYQVSMLMAGGSNQELEFGIAVNGVRQPSTTCHRKIGTASDTGSASGMGELILDEGDLLQLVVRNETSTNNVIIEHGQLRLRRTSIKVG